MESTNTLSLLLILSLFALTSATFIVPEDVNVAFNGAPHKKSIDVSSTYKLITLIDIARESINVAKEAGVNVLYFMKNVNGVNGHMTNHPAMIKCISTCSANIEVAVKELNKCVTLMDGKTNLSEVELEKINKSVKIASKSALECNVKCKQSKADMQVMFKNLLDQFMKMSNVAVKATSKITLVA